MRKGLAVLVAAAVISVAGCSTMDSMMGTPPPTKVMDGVLTNSCRHDAVHVRQGRGRQWQERLQRSVRDQLAAAAGGCGREGAAGDYTIITRDDGAKQWAYKGKPLYLWIKDSKPGDRTGDGFNNAWRLRAQDLTTWQARASARQTRNAAFRACGAMPLH